MTVRAFVVLLGVTVLAIWLGDRIAQDFAAPGLERTFTVLVIAAALVAPAAWLLGRIEFSRNSQTPRNGGQA